jgi:hypothetical protein
MTRNRPGRLWTPVIAAVAGTAISIAVAVGKDTWVAVVIGEAATAVSVVVICLMASSDSDLGAVLGRGADERQDLVRLKATRVSSLVAVIASVTATIIAAANNSTYWPFELIYALTGVAYLVSLKVYGVRDSADSAG